MAREFDIQMSDYESFEEYVDDYMTLFKEEMKEGFEGGDHDIDIDDYDDFDEFLEDFFDEFEVELKDLISGEGDEVIQSPEQLREDDD